MKSLILVSITLSAMTSPLMAQSEPVTAASNAARLTEESLGSILTSIGLKPIKTDKRYDFAFKTTIRGEEWKFSMSAVLSRNSESVWLMAWLDQIPSQSSNVPRTALLKLLAANDRLGNGKFFAYIPTNKRFVLQRVIKNDGMSTRKMMDSLQDLAVSVADEYPIWSVAKWSPVTPGQPAIAAGGQSAAGNGTVPVPPTSNANASARTIRTSDAAPKLNNRQIR
ncbi:MAG: hypothetical protein ABJZ55_19650 [Fuerstiella sp.]